MNPSLSQLRALHADPQASARAARERGMPVVGVIGAVIPTELIIAAGCFPIALRAVPDDAGRDSAPMEAEHEAEVRSLFLQAMRGDFAVCDLIVIASTTDGYRYLYQYLKQMVRSGRADQLPPLLLYDFLFGESPAVRRYDREVLRQFAARLAMLSGQVAAPESLMQAIHDGNRQRARLEALATVRERGRVAGTEAFLAIEATTFLDATASEALLDGIIAATGAPLDRPRLLISSSVPLSGAGLHQLIEQAGGTVIAEDDAAGARRAGPQIVPGTDAQEALLDHYLRHTASPRQPTATREGWFVSALSSGFDGVVFYMPPEDQVFGWRYPALAGFCASAGVPSLLIREDISTAAGLAAAQEAACTFVTGLEAQA